MFICCLFSGSTELSGGLIRERSKQSQAGASPPLPSSSSSAPALGKPHRPPRAGPGPSRETAPQPLRSRGHPSCGLRAGPAPPPREALPADDGNLRGLHSCGGCDRQTRDGQRDRPPLPCAGPPRHVTAAHWLRRRHRPGGGACPGLGAGPGRGRGGAGEKIF